MRQPGDAVGLAAAGGVLDQVIAAGALASCRRDQFAHGVALVVAREDHRLGDDAPLAAGAVVDFLLVLLDEHEAAEDVEQAVALQHLFPQIAGTVPRRVRRVAGTAFDRTGMAAAVEWQEMRSRSPEP